MKSNLTSNDKAWIDGFFAGQESALFNMQPLHRLRKQLSIERLFGLAFLIMAVLWSRKKGRNHDA